MADVNTIVWGAGDVAVSTLSVASRVWDSIQSAWGAFTRPLSDAVSQAADASYHGGASELARQAGLGDPSDKYKQQKTLEAGGTKADARGYANLDPSPQFPSAAELQSLLLQGVLWIGIFLVIFLLVQVVTD